MKTLIPFNEIRELRIQTRKRRRQLNRYQLKKSESATVFKILQQPQIKHYKNIGIYLDGFGEVPTKQLMLELFKRHKNVYLPLICNMNQKLRWQKISLQQWRAQRFSLHHLGMKQAVQSRGQSIDHLDVLIMPLVLFDQVGNRVGMGGGFYDRTLAHTGEKPFRLGLAHQFQMTQNILMTQSWDQPLDMVISPKHIFNFKR